jgi:hypothetical protein
MVCSNPIGTFVRRGQKRILMILSSLAGKAAFLAITSPNMPALLTRLPTKVPYALLYELVMVNGAAGRCTCPYSFNVTRMALTAVRICVKML